MTFMLLILAFILANPWISLFIFISIVYLVVDALAKLFEPSPEAIQKDIEAYRKKVNESLRVEAEARAQRAKAEAQAKAQARSDAAEAAALERRQKEEAFNELRAKYRAKY
jgi:Skp family chaperone for outer membrane proteins